MFYAVNPAANVQVCFESILARLCAVALMALPFVVVFGYAYQRTSGVPLGRSLFKAYAVLQRVPGANACNDEKLPSVWVMNLTHVVCPSVILLPLLTPGSMHA